MRVIGLVFTQELKTLRSAMVLLLIQETNMSDRMFSISDQRLGRQLIWFQLWHFTIAHKLELD